MKDQTNNSLSYARVTLRRQSLPENRVISSVTLLVQRFKQERGVNPAKGWKKEVIDKSS